MFSSKQFERNWRPTCHLVCCIVHGVCEAFYVMDHDCRKSSDMNLTIIMRTLDHALAILEERGVKAPSHIAIQTDNTTREQRNQYTFLFFCWAVGKGFWGSASPNFYLPGHSHNECDQRFVPVAAALMRSEQLQTPDDIQLLLVEGNFSRFLFIPGCFCSVPRFKFGFKRAQFQQQAPPRGSRFQQPDLVYSRF